MTTSRATSREDSKAKAKPFVKWVGGKRQLLAELLARLPGDLAELDYFEPFVGGGALTWSVAGSAMARTITINDMNAELINAYKVVRDQPLELLAHLRTHEHCPDYYYALRSLDRQESFERLDAVARASRFVYLNKTGFNGLWRVNSKGQHNVPFGRYKNPKIIDEPTILACSAALQSVLIFSGDFRELSTRYDDKTFVYFDPPYVPVSQSSNFTSYTAQGFDAQMQQDLVECCEHIDRVGGRFMLSNSDTPLVRKLWEGFQIETVYASRAINSKAKGRGQVAEVIIRNYFNANEVTP